MITVEEAEKIILSQRRDFGTERIPFEQALNRVLAEDLKADRDLPPFNRVTMDGIAINFDAFAKGINSFKIYATQAAGELPIDIDDADGCIEIMTGAALPSSTNTVIRYEDVEIRNSVAHLRTADVKAGQNIHYKGTDKRQGDVVAKAAQVVTPAIISLAASIGAINLEVKKQQRVVVISSGDELVDVTDEPDMYQIRRSNSYTLKAALANHGLQAGILHVPDDPAVITHQLKGALDSYDAIILSGGVSMGKFDYIPKALDELGVKQLFHKVLQRPGKPFWFGAHQNGVAIFAFPGNPVASFMCLYRYFLPWAHAAAGLTASASVYAVLNSDFTFKPDLKYFLQVKLQSANDGRLLATPIEGNGSGDFANLAATDAFMELPLETKEFKAGDAYRIWPFK